MWMKQGRVRREVYGASVSLLTLQGIRCDMVCMCDTGKYYFLNRQLGKSGRGHKGVYPSLCGRCYGSLFYPSSTVPIGRLASGFYNPSWDRSLHRDGDRLSTYLLKPGWVLVLWHNQGQAEMEIQRESRSAYQTNGNDTGSVGESAINLPCRGQIQCKINTRNVWSHVTLKLLSPQILVNYLFLFCIRYTVRRRVVWRKMHVIINQIKKSVVQIRVIKWSRRFCSVIFTYIPVWRRSEQRVI